jgi:uncharacterized membrane protein
MTKKQHQNDNNITNNSNTINEINKSCSNSSGKVITTALTAARAMTPRFIPSPPLLSSGTKSCPVALGVTLALTRYAMGSASQVQDLNPSAKAARCAGCPI